MNENLISGGLLSQTTSVLTTHFGFVALTFGVDKKNINSLKLIRVFISIFRSVKLTPTPTKMSTERELAPGGPNQSLHLPAAFQDFKELSVNLLEKVYGEWKFPFLTRFFSVFSMVKWKI